MIYMFPVLGLLIGGLTGNGISGLIGLNGDLGTVLSDARGGVVDTVGGRAQVVEPPLALPENVTLQIDKLDTRRELGGPPGDEQSLTVRQERTFQQPCSRRARRAGVETARAVALLRGHHPIQ